jgi:hypothetical protein
MLAHHHAVTSRVLAVGQMLPETHGRRAGDCWDEKAWVDYHERCLHCLEWGCRAASIVTAIEQVVYNVS